MGGPEPSDSTPLQCSMVLQLDPRFWQIGDGDGDDPPDSNWGWDPRPRPRTNGGWGPGMGIGVSAPCCATSAVHDSQRPHWLRLPARAHERCSHAQWRSCMLSPNWVRSWYYTAALHSGSQEQGKNLGNPLWTPFPVRPSKTGLVNMRQPPSLSI